MQSSEMNPESNVEKNEVATKLQVPFDFCCPLTGKVMLQPVILNDGETYEKEEIMARLSKSELQSPRCPATTLNAASMIPNRSVHRLIAKWLQKNSENLCSVEIYEMRMKLRQLVDALKMCDEVALEDIMNTELVDFDRSSEGLSGTTLLHVVFRFGNDAIIRKMREFYTLHNVPDAKGWVPLQVLAVYNSLEALQGAVSVDRDLVNVVLPLPSEPAVFPVVRTDTTMEMAFPAKQDIPQEDWNALMDGVRQKTVDALSIPYADHLVDFLLNLNPQGNDKSFFTRMLHLACEYGRIEVVKSLIRRGAEVNNQKEGTGFTPLMTAANSGYPDICHYLVENGADVSLHDIFANNALHWAESTDVADVLLRAGINCKQRNTERKTPAEALANEVGDYIQKQADAMHRARRQKRKEMEQQVAVEIPKLREDVSQLKRALEEKEEELQTMAKKLKSVQEGGAPTVQKIDLAAASE